MPVVSSMRARVEQMTVSLEDHRHEPLLPSRRSVDWGLNAIRHPRATWRQEQAHRAQQGSVGRERETA